MEKKARKILSLGLLAVLIAFFAYYLYNNIDDFRSLRFGNPLLLIPLFAIGIVTTALYGLVTKFVLEPFNIRLKFKEWFGLICITNFYNMITPFRGGMIARAVYLKKKYKLEYTDFLASFIGIYIIFLLSDSFLGLVSVWMIYYYMGVFNPIVLLVFLAFFIPLLFIVVFSPKFPESKNQIVGKFVRIANCWHLIRGQKKIVIFAVFNTILILGLGVVSSVISYRFVGVEIGIVAAIFLVAVNNLAFVTQLTPGNLGVAEAINVFFAIVVGIEPAEALAVSILGRVIGMSILFILGPVYSYILLKERPSKDSKREKNIS